MNDDAQEFIDNAKEPAMIVSGDVPGIYSVAEEGDVHSWGKLWVLGVPLIVDRMLTGKHWFLIDLDQLKHKIRDNVPEYRAPIVS